MNNRSNTLLSIGISIALIAVAFLFLGHWGFGRWAGGGGWWHMHHGYYLPGGMMGFGGGGVISLLFWGVVILAVILLVASGIAGSKFLPSTTRGPLEAKEIIKRRYANGDIDREQFVTQMDTLKKIL